MSNVSVHPGDPEVTLQQPPRSFTRRVLGETFARWGARIGAAWILLLAFAAVAAPFVCSSHPYLMQTEGQWSSPLLRHLTAADVTFLIAAIAIIVLLLVPMRPNRRLLIFLGVVVVTIPLAFLLIDPPSPVVYEQYRELEAKGNVDFILRAPIEFSPTDRLRDQPQALLMAPSATHLMGTSTTGADVFSRMFHAARIALSIGFIATGIAMIIGVAFGGLTGYFSGIVDLIGMRLLEIFEAIPGLFLLLIIVSIIPADRAWQENKLYIIMIVIGLTSWTGYARFVRAEFLRLRQQDFVQAAVACGLPLGSVLFRHMLPNGVTPVLVSASFGVASAILYEAVLSFLGFGLIDEPSWGQLLNQASGSTGAFSWWLAIYPGAAIFLTVFAYNLIGEALRDAIDPHTKRAAQI